MKRRRKKKAKEEEGRKSSNSDGGGAVRRRDRRGSGLGAWSVVLGAWCLVLGGLGGLESVLGRGGGKRACRAHSGRLVFGSAACGAERLKRPGWIQLACQWKWDGAWRADTCRRGCVGGSGGCAKGRHLNPSHLHTSQPETTRQKKVREERAC